VIQEGRVSYIYIYVGGGEEFITSFHCCKFAQHTRNVEKQNMATFLRTTSILLIFS